MWIKGGRHYCSWFNFNRALTSAEAQVDQEAYFTKLHSGGPTVNSLPSLLWEVPHFLEGSWFVRKKCYYQHIMEKNVLHSRTWNDSDNSVSVISDKYISTLIFSYLRKKTIRSSFYTIRLWLGCECLQMDDASIWSGKWETVQTAEPCAAAKLWASLFVGLLYPLPSLCGCTALTKNTQRRTEKANGDQGNSSLGSRKWINKETNFHGLDGRKWDRKHKV